MGCDGSRRAILKNWPADQQTCVLRRFVALLLSVSIAQSRKDRAGSKQFLARLVDDLDDVVRLARAGGQQAADDIEIGHRGRERLIDLVDESRRHLDWRFVDRAAFPLQRNDDAIRTIFRTGMGAHAYAPVFIPEMRPTLAGFFRAKHFKRVICETVVIELLTKAPDGLSFVAGLKSEQHRRLRREAFYAQLVVERQNSDVGSGYESLHIVAGLTEAFQLGFQFLVFLSELFVRLHVTIPAKAVRVR